MKKLNFGPPVDGKILLVDDEPDILELYGIILQKYNMEVATANDGQEAWEIFKQEEKIPVVVTDINMPRMNGVELLMKIMQDSPMTQFVVITAFLDDSVSLFGVKSNVVCLPKPVEAEFVAIAVAGAYKRYLHDLWQERLKSAIMSDNWDEAGIMAILKQAPWVK